jgi:hypothetical protein
VRGGVKVVCLRFRCQSNAPMVPHGAAWCHIAAGQRLIVAGQRYRRIKFNPSIAHQRPAHVRGHFRGGAASGVCSTCAPRISGPLTCASRPSARSAAGLALGQDGGPSHRTGPAPFVVPGHWLARALIVPPGVSRPGHPGPLSSEGTSTAGWGNRSNVRCSPCL